MTDSSVDRVLLCTAGSGSHQADGVELRSLEPAIDDVYDALPQNGDTA